MNKIINGRKYDTNTAKEIFECTFLDSSSVTLYQKKTGEFFLYYWGSLSGERIEPLTENEAKDWVADKTNADAYEELFGPVEE